MEFRTKKEVLEYLGKDVKDVRLIDRMIKRGEIKKEGSLYIYESREVELEKEIKNLKDKLVNMPKDDKISSSWEVAKLKEEIKWLNSDLDFQIAENEKLKDEIKEYQNAIRNCYYYVYKFKKVVWYDFRDNVLKLKKELPWEDNN